MQLLNLKFPFFSIKFLITVINQYSMPNSICNIFQSQDQVLNKQIINILDLHYSVLFSLSFKGCMLIFGLGHCFGRVMRMQVSSSFKFPFLRISVIKHRRHCPWSQHLGLQMKVYVIRYVWINSELVFLKMSFTEFTVLGGFKTVSFHSKGPDLSKFWITGEHVYAQSLVRLYCAI